MVLWLLPSLILTLNRDVGLWQILLQKSVEGFREQ
jgi:hypothetical protein